MNKKNFELGSFVRVVMSCAPKYIPVGARGQIQILNAPHEHLVKFEKYGEAWLCHEELEVVNATTIYIFFGEMGSGKSYLGQRFAKQIDANFYEGDDSLPEQTRRKVQAGKPLTTTDVDEFVRCHLLPDIQREASFDLTRPLVVSQALYSDKHRHLLKERLNAAGHDVIFHYVKVGFWKNLKQLWSRPNGKRWVANWLISKPFFQKPTQYCVDLKIL